MSRSFEPLRGVAFVAVGLGLFVSGCSPEGPAAPAQGKMDAGKMTPPQGAIDSGKMDSGKMDSGKMDSGKMDPAGKK